MFQTDDSHGKGRYWSDLIFSMGADLKLVLLSTVVMLAFLYTPGLDQTVLKLAFGLAMLLFIPGYTFVAAVFPKSSDMKGLERAALSFGMSICLFPMISLALSYTPWGLRFGPLVVSLTVVTIALSLAASMRRLRLPEKERFSVDFGKALKEIKAVVFVRRSGYDTALILIMILAILSSIVTIGYAVGLSRHEERFTEFYVLGPNGTADSYPTSFNYGDTKEVIVGVANHESRNVTYNLQVLLNDSMNEYVQYDESVPIADNQSWNRAINLTPQVNGTGMRLDFRLYVDGDLTKPYRECHFKINVANST